MKYFIILSHPHKILQDNYNLIHKQNVYSYLNRLNYFERLLTSYFKVL